MIGTLDELRSSRQTSRPRAVRKADVEQYEVGAERSPTPERVRDGVRDLGVEAVPLERFGERSRDRLLVLDDQDRPLLVAHLTDSALHSGFGRAKAPRGRGAAARLGGC